MTGLTDHQAALFARELQRRCPSGETGRIGTALLDAQVDLNPHQVDAALFAFQSPLSKGVILADEVGLGKTIEAGLVLTQRWAEGRRRVLVVAPASLRKQWAQELADKFYLPSTILEAKSFSAAVKAGARNAFVRPTDNPAVVICSYQFAARHSDDLAAARWDLAILDEAHRLRNVWKSGAKIATAIRAALATTPKLLLTATPLQNSLMELYGLVSIIDENHFGDAKSFKAQYARLVDLGRFDELKARLEPVCHRTLRRQVVEYVSYTNRVPLTQEFQPSDGEQALYDMVSDYLRRPELYALPSGQRSLMVLVMRKLLASSTFAIAGALGTLAGKLRSALRADDDARSRLAATVDEELADDYEDLPAQAEEWSDPPPDEDQEELDRPLTEEERAALVAEIDELTGFRDLATSITENARGLALLSALQTGFTKARVLGAADKAVIFTESRRTQDYLVGLLSRSGYEGRIVLFNGSNSDPESRAIYREWKERHQGTSRITGSPTADMRAALVERFRDHGTVMIATEAAAEGINLQFCSMVVNYDLPWNPQRIEQRIGRCHRYGQKHDVVVVNFLNRRNAADVRVFELLHEKLRLFSGVFGASDDVLGAIESGVDIERRIVDIYQDCRTSDEIDAQFTQLQLDLDQQISATMEDTRSKLLEHFDAEVHDRLRVSLSESTEVIDRSSDVLWRITEHVLAGHATIDPATRSFALAEAPPFAPATAPGRYRLTREDGAGAMRYRSQHPLALAVVDRAAVLPCPSAELCFDYSGWPVRSQALAPLVGTSGIVIADHLRLAGEEPEDHLVILAVTDDGTTLDPEAGRRLLDVPARVEREAAIDIPDTVIELAAHRLDALLDAISGRQGAWFEEEMDKLDRWADDKRTGLKADLKAHDDVLKEFKREARQAPSLPDKLAIQRKIRKVEVTRNEAWRAYDDEARTVEEAKEALIDDVERRLAVDPTVERLWTIRFTIS
ncbi:SNF2-related protein [Iamia majanohamensis]|uniref:SNF2-related protein n=1 Tax=Iamia majanohamensis TaxID=467976 RepID=A0AAE9YD12_9ACTN|nr:SNF2-related protein [Iamia majanohamensis]WCO68938.1 SNF2-related protein [Iamia majanohamensis]